MPFAAKNMFYDEQWKEKQQRGFTWWLNFVLTPDDFTLKTDISQVNAACLILGTETYKTSVPKAPTKEEASLRAYTTRCKLNRLRRSACRLFTCDEMVKAIKRLEIEIEAKRLLVRKDRHLWKDIGERQKILNWLLCYNPLWLRIGLETIFGELIALESNSDVMGLAVFILNRLLWNPDIAAEYRHPTVPHFYRDGHEEALSKFTLKKLLLLVCFLDRAKVSRIIEHDPCLFFKNADFKSSKEILLAFSRDFLSGEGDLSRHLGFLGFPVNHIQTPLDEFDFAVTNLATDLQCGIRLVRTLELLTSDWTLSKKLRVPAISRLQKMYNVKLAFEILNNHGIQLKDENGSTIDTKDIVDRHREKTFALLWKIVFAFQVNISLDMDQLKAEIAFLKNMQVTKLKRHDVECVNSMGNDTSRSYSYESYGENVKLLMDWVNVVCGFYNIKVENFTVSFSDGRVLCYLIHHYHPCYVPLEAVCKLTTQTIECTRSGTLGMNSSSESDASLNLINGTFDQSNTSVLYKELLDNEKKNFQLINAAISDLGGVPAMIQHSDMSNTIPDEKVVIIYVSFLCSRLISLSKEIRAAQLIQSAWRKYRLKILTEVFRKRIVYIIIFFQTKKQKINAVVVLQKHWRRYLAVLELQKLKKAKQEETGRIAIQRWQEAVIVLQAWYRMKRERKRFLKMSGAASVIQTYYRAHREQTFQRQKFLQIKKATLRLQASYRGFKVRRMLRHQHTAATKIQATYRAYAARMKYQSLIQASIVIQKWYRTSKSGSKIRKRYQKTKAAVISLQAVLRGWQVRKWLQRQRAAAITIQSAYRKHKAMKKFRMVRHAALTIQQHYRAHISSKKQQQEYIILYNSIVLFQATWRGIIVRRQIERQHQAAVTIQSYYRMHVIQAKFKHFIEATVTIQRWYRAVIQARNTRQKYLALKEATVKMQAIYRGLRERRKIQRLNQAAICIQSMFKMHQSRKNYRALKAAAISLQRRYRATVLSKQQREKFLNLCRAVIVIQSTIRGLLVRRYVKQMHLAATAIQATFRMHITYTRYRTIKSACVVIQHHYRAYQTAKQIRDLYLKQCHSALILQAAYRGMKVRHMLKKKHEAAVVLQSNYRKHRQWKSYKNIQWAVRLVQARVRANQESKAAVQQYCSIKKATICIQKAFRRMKARNQRRQEAAVLLQRNFKMQRARKNYLALKAAAISFQRKYRALVVMRRQTKEYASVRKKIICVQSFYRGFKIRKEVKRQHLAATVIQATFRMYKVKLAYQKLRYATITMQKYYRSHLQEKYQNTHQAIQKSIRSQVTCRETKIQPELDIMNISATITQSLYWMYVQQKHSKLIWWAVVTIQSAFRGMVARKKTKKMRAARNRQLCHIAVNDRTGAIESKSECHTNKAGEQYQKYWKAAVLIQEHYRSYLTMKHHSTVYLQTCKRIILLQATVRGFIERQRFSRMKKSTIKIQRWYRGNWQRRKYLQYRKKIIIIQRMVRRWISHRNINTGGIPKDINPENVNTGVTKFQALWRGYSWRKKTDTPETRSLRDSLIIANKESKEEKKLYNRTAVAIDYLLKYKHFSYILAALKDLEVVTRLSPVCCENMAQSKAVCTIFTLIRSCNRSVPSMDVIKYSVQVLLNLSKYERTTDAVYSVENSVETLLDLLQMYREKAGDKTSEKSGSIFTKTCCLFAHLSKDSRRASEIRNNHKTVASLRRLFRLTARKHQMDVQRKLAKQKKVAYINGQSSIPVKTKIVSRQRPDWDLKKDNIREIVDPLQAIEMVVNTLGISCN
ncbi:abnormal spindle-like microcephaly-associated protein [Pseudonaja textilis]|uniref:abnormal spindle-like microcephaly-associated protein n=1 Tax=Pseudonaja textilis TaxID=8673 RepID=UPI000EA8F01C|nr:abnormal spindle-like microcephaly-associated protein [Pseudonaja textilis]